MPPAGRAANTVPPGPDRQWITSLSLAHCLPFPWRSVNNTSTSGVSHAMREGSCPSKSEPHPATVRIIHVAFAQRAKLEFKPLGETLYRIVRQTAHAHAQWHFRAPVAINSTDSTRERQTVRLRQSGFRNYVLQFILQTPICIMSECGPPWKTAMFESTDASYRTRPHDVVFDFIRYCVLQGPSFWPN